MEYFLLESALLMLAAYFVGAILGCLLRRLFTPRRPRKDIGGDTAAATATAAGTAAAAATQLRDAPEPVQPKIETVAEATPPEDSGVAESARFERVLTAAPAEAEGEATAQSEETSEASAAEESSAAAAAAAAAIAAGAAAATALTSEKTETPATPAQPAARYPSVGGTVGMSSVSAPIAEPGPPADDLRQIEGVDAETATSLNQLGYTRFAQIADWKMADIKRVNEAFGDNRATAGGWVEQARMLADGKETGHLRRLAGKGPSSPWATLAAAAAPVAAAAAVAATKPAAATGPVDLRLIEGIDDKTNAILVQNGITNFKQIAFWKREDVAQMDQVLGEPGRISRENWIEQARMLDDGKTTHFTQHKTAAVAVTPPAAGLPDPEPLPTSQAGAAAAVTAVAAAATAAVSATASTAPEAEPLADNDLKRIEGIDAAAETLLKSNGIQSYSQIAKWTSSDVQKFDGLLQQPGRISKENWIEQAKILADGKETAFTSGRETNWPASEVAAASAAAAPAASNEPDDLMRIQGIDAGVRDMLNSKGVKSFAQISKWTPAHVEKVDSILGEPGRVSRENWIGQALALATGAPMPEAATPAPASPASEPASSAASTATAAAAAATVAAAAAVAASSATASEPDDLKRISGIDPEIEAMLHSKGVRSYSQISKWTAAHVNKVDSLLNDTGRVERENWVEQARLLAEGKDPTAAQSAPPPVAETAPSTSARPARLADAIRQNAGSAGSVSSVAGMRSVRSELLSGPNKAPEIVDDLKKIRGIGVLIEKKLNAMGVFAYEQIANWSAGEIERISNALDFKGRIEREGWVQQARILASGGQTEFSKRLS